MPSALEEYLKMATVGPSYALAKDVTLTPGSPETIGQLLMGAPKMRTKVGMDPSGQPTFEQSQGFWGSGGGKALGSILGLLAMSGVGAGLGAITGGRRGAARGATVGGTLGTLTDLAQRRAASEAPGNLATIMAKMNEDKPNSAKEYEYYANQLKLTRPGQQPMPYERFLTLKSLATFQDPIHLMNRFWNWAKDKGINLDEATGAAGAAGVVGGGGGQGGGLTVDW